MTTLLVTSCSAGVSETTAAPTTTEAPATTLAPVTTEASTTTIAEEPGQEQHLPGGYETVGDKSVLLDGFIGMRIPDGWEITGAKVPLASQTEGTETELDTTALDKVLGVEPAATSGAATFSLVHTKLSRTAIRAG